MVVGDSSLQVHIYKFPTLEVAPHFFINMSLHSGTPQDSSSIGTTSSDTSDELVVSDSLIRSYHATIRDALHKHEYNFVICDPSLPDHPIVYASEGFQEMTGYSREEVVGRNCRFLQGPATDKRAILEIREAIREERPCQVKLVNYTKSGKPFWNLFHLAPVFSQQDGRVVHFVGVQTPISSAVAASIDKQVPDSGRPEEEDEDEDEEEEECNVTEDDKQRAFAAVKSVLTELADSSNKGVGPRRSKSLSGAVSRGVVCTSLMLSLTRIQQSFVLADPHLPDTPIVHASDFFLKLTGYSREEVMGRNCRFLQGPDTDQEAVEKMRTSIKREQPCTVRVLNYRKNKEPFWNYLHIAPVRNANGKVAYLAGVQLDVTSVDEDDECDARMKQLGAVGAIRVAVRSLQSGSVMRRALTIS
uniref:Putative LOV domain-containing protein n=1 Tax=Selaginella willdenowii TaxID=137179 RepID=A0A126WZZ1_9TRAC|nr:putative LOV domain-containing protein [Selaginella willdenowii]